MYLCQQAGTMSLREIADAFGLGRYASASAAICRVARRIGQE